MRVCSGQNTYRPLLSVPRSLTFSLLTYTTSTMKTAVLSLVALTCSCADAFTVSTASLR